MQIKLFHFSKKHNSTKRPSDSSAVSTREVYMKADTSVMNPVFLLSKVDLNVNYIKWDNNYYFVTDIVLNDEGIYEIHSTMDVLATAKNDILDTSAIVMYAHNANKNIIDTRIPLTSDVTLSDNYKALSNVSIMDETMGAIVLGLTGKGSFGSYLLENSSNVSKLLDGVDSWWDGTVESAMDAWKQLIHGGSAAECLKSAIAIPLLFSPGDVSSSGAEQLVLGAYPCKKDIDDQSSTPIRGYRITKPLLTDSTNIDIPWMYSDWRRNPPYSQVILYLPLIGLVTLPTVDVINDTSLNVLYKFNITSGDVSVQIRGNQSGRIFSTSSGNIAMNTAFGSTGIDTTKATTSIVAGAAAVVGGIASIVASGGATTPAVLGIAGGMATAAGGTLTALGGTGSGNGGLGGGSSHGLDKVIHCYVVSRTLTDSPSNLNSLMGKPYHAKAAISSFSGYVQTEGFSLAGNYLDSIRDNVNGMMDRGVYIE